MLTFILIIILISLLIRYLLPYLLPRLLMFWFKKQQKSGGSWQQNQQKPEGSVNIKYAPPQPDNKQKPSSEGEYVDFEEINK